MHTYAPSTHANTHAHAALTNSEDAEHIGYDLSQKPSAGQYLHICPGTLPTPTPTPKHKILLRFIYLHVSFGRAYTSYVYMYMYMLCLHVFDADTYT
jgi:hypothetical protein